MDASESSGNSDVRLPRAFRELGGGGVREAGGREEGKGASLRCVHVKERLKFRIVLAEVLYARV